MTTHVPAGTSADAVADIRGRESARAAELAAQGHLQRLWRPPLQPGEWRTLGLFTAGTEAELEDVLASMPLQVWRSDEVTPLAPHPNDPPGHAQTPRSPAGGHEFLTTFTLAVPTGTPAETVAAVTAGEAARTRELAEQGQLRRLWTLPGPGQALGLWRADDTEALQGLLATLPMSAWLSVHTTQLSPHPSDPAG